VWRYGEKYLQLTKPQIHYRFLTGKKRTANKEKEQSMNNRLSPSGHIPLDEETLSGFSAEERAFWELFQSKILVAINEGKERGTPPPYRFSPELYEMFQKAVYTYDGLKYCQVNQICNLFDTTDSVAQ
jgi:hypothetical protein